MDLTKIRRNVRAVVPIALGDPVSATHRTQISADDPGQNYTTLRIGRAERQSPLRMNRFPQRPLAPQHRHYAWL